MLDVVFVVVTVAFFATVAIVSRRVDRS